MLVIVDYGLGNLGSIANMFKRLGIPATVSSDPSTVKTASRLVLPGVGAFDHGMKSLRSRELVGPLTERVNEGVPILGICLGAQLMTRGSEEGSEPGLGWLDIATVRFDNSRGARELKIPHMGWSDVVIGRATSLFPDPQEQLRFYFVHSYHFVCDSPEDVATTSTYGYSFVSSFARRNVFGVQYHPEKSHRFGMTLLKRFSQLS
jgi:glutamine amidotransferase